MRCLSPSDAPAGHERRGHQQHDSSGVVLLMRGWLTALAEWCRLPLLDGFAELDVQIGKLRLLRDSYRATPQEDRHCRMADAEKGGKQLCPQ